VRMTQEADLAARLARLERANRRLVGFMVLTTVFGLLGTGAWVSANATGRVEARQFVLLDAKGRTRGEWQIDPEGRVWVLIYGPDGKVEASLPGRVTSYPAH
jgi:hypothetical protein